MIGHSIDFCKGKGKEQAAHRQRQPGNQQNLQQQSKVTTSSVGQLANPAAEQQNEGAVGQSSGPNQDTANWTESAAARWES